MKLFSFGGQDTISTLEGKLKGYFMQSMNQQFIFGSYSRGTILPRLMDKQSDVDYMIVFSKIDSTPQTYLNKLRLFAEKNYSRSEIFQSNPTIVLSLNHICFELVPAIKVLSYGYQIPAKYSDYQKWLTTDPTSFNDKLSKANQSHNNLIKPLTRIIKYWNTSSDYPFESYELEKKIIENGFGLLGLLGGQLKDYFYEFVKSLYISYLAAEWKRQKVDRLKKIAEESKKLEEDGHTYLAEEKIKKILPPVI